MISNYFLLFRRLPFHSVDCFLWCSEVLSLMQSHLSILAFVACAFGVLSKKLLPNPLSQSFLPVFSSRSFMFLGLRFRSLIQFWVNFCIQCTVGVQLHSFACRYPVLPAPFIEETVLFPLCAFGMRVNFWALCLFHWSVYLSLLPVSHCFL